uniref:hypothetical protein n=1 Tax=Candidatus Scatocola faecigallinarum TaxID=2840916 RepID=UPI004024F2F4
MTARKLEDHIVKAFKDLGFEDKDITAGCWQLERKINGVDTPIAWIVYHKFLERVAQKAGIVFDKPEIFNLEQDEIALYVNGKKGDFSAWAIGEASKENLTATSKNYRWAMAEKRAKDRVILKLLGIAGDVYSEEEADDFKQKPEKPDFEKDAAKEKAAQTKAINKALNEGKKELPPVQTGKEILKRQFESSVEYLNGITNLSTKPKSTMDKLNSLCVNLFEADMMDEHATLTRMINERLNLNDGVIY